MKQKKYIGLYETVRDKILRGEYRPGERLPSKRVAADRYGCSLITAERAYMLLEDEGYIVARQRSGYFVCAAPSLPPGSGERPPETPYRLPEPAAQPAEGFESSVWVRTVRRVLSEHPECLSLRSPDRGCAVLRNAIADYLLRYRGMHADPRRIVIGSGAEQLYECVVKLLGRERIYGIEDPSYDRIRIAYGGMGASVCPLRLGEDGIDSEALRRNHFDVLHVTPFHSYPSGITTSIAKRCEYLRRSARDGIYIVEDDYDSEFFLPGHPIESLYSLGGGERIVYINTFSRSLSPAMRLGYMILPEDLSEVYDRRIGGSPCSVPVPDQYILAAFIADGSFERHLNRMRRRMKRP